MIKVGNIVKFRDFEYWSDVPGQIPMGIILSKSHLFHSTVDRWVTTIYDISLYDYCSDEVLKIIT